MTTEVTKSEPEGSSEHRRRLWVRALGWIGGVIALLVLLIVVSVAVLLHSARFHNYLRKVAERKASAMLGTQVQLEDFSVRFSNLTLELYGLTIHGAEPYPNPPLLLVRHAEVGVRIVSILHRKWYLNTIRIDDPVVRVFTGANGISNLPTLKSSGGSHTSVFDLGIRHAVLDDGEVYYNNRKSVLEADLNDVNFRSTFDSALKKYSGSLSYRNGMVQTGGFSPVVHDLDVRFSATPAVLHLESAKLTSGGSQFVLTGTMRNYSQPEIAAQYEAVIEGGDVARIMHNPSIPDGRVRAIGTVAYSYRPNVSGLDAVVLNGTVSSRVLKVQTAKARLQLTGLGAQVSLADGNATVKDFRVHLLGGEVTGALAMRNLTGPTHSMMNASLRGISLADLARMAPSSAAAHQVALRGALNGDASAAWGKTLNDLVAHANLRMNGNVSRRGSPNVNAIPVSGTIRGTYTAATKEIALSNSSLHMPATTLTMNGDIGRRSGLAVQLQSSDLSELETIADLVRTPAPGQAIQPLGLGGTASFQGMVRGTTTAPHLIGQLTVSNLRIRDTSWRVLRTGIDASPSLVRLQHANLEPAGHGHIALDASAQLRHWAFSKSSPVRVQLDASGIDAANLEKLAGSQLPLSGTIAATIAAQGTLLNPVGHGSLTLSRAEVYQQPVKSARVTFNATGGNASGKFTVDVAGGSLHGAADVQPKQQTYSAQVTASGIQLSKLRALSEHNVAATGVIQLNGSGKGTFSNPQFDATLTLPQLAIEQQKIDNLALHMNVANHVANATLDSQAVGTYVQADARVDLKGDYETEATLNTKAIPLQPLLAVYAPSAGTSLGGETEVHATMRGPLKNKKLMEAHVTLPMLKMNYGSAIQLGAASPIHIDYRNQVLNLQRAVIRGTDTDLQIQGTVPMAGSAPVSLLLLGTVNLQLAQAFNSDVRSSGQLRFDINSYGARTDPNLEGKVEVVNANFANGNLPIGLQHGNGVLLLTKDRLNVQSFKATVGGGTVTAQGGVAYRPAIQFDLGAAAKGVRMLYPQGVREQVDADLRLAGTPKNAILGGRVQVQDLSFTPDFDLTSFMGNLSGGVTPPPSQGFSQNLRLNLQVNSTNNLNLVSRALSVGGTANLQVRGTAAQPVILGRINLDNGDLIFNGNRFTLAGGTVEFVNPAETQPVVNVAINTTIQQYNIHLRFNGPVNQLHTNYASDPSLPAADIINLLAFGQTTEAGQANPTPGNQAAMGLVASQVSSQITSRVAKIAGISQLSINPVLSGDTAQGPAGAIVTVQQRVTGNLFVTFSSNVTTTQDQVIMGQYNLSRRTSVSATRDQNGGFGFDTTFRKTW